MTLDIAAHAPLIYTPAFWKPENAYKDYVPDLEGAFVEGQECRRKRGLRTADELRAAGISNLAMLTDLQQDFRPRGRLPVAGTDDVVLRVCARLLNGTFTEYFTDVVYSLDGHPAYHTSYGASWLKADTALKARVPFDLRTNKAALLTLVDDRMGVFEATCFGPSGPYSAGHIQRAYNVKDSVAYAKHLEATGQGPVWVFATHCKLGTDGVNLHPLVAEVLAFMEGARMIQPTPLSKGHIRDTDWFGPLAPCRPDTGHPQGGFQKGIVDQFEHVTGNVEFSGVAEDFCDYNMKRQTMGHFDGTPFFGKMVFLSDGTAPIVPNAPQVITLNEQARAKGVRFITHDAAF